MKTKNINTTINKYILLEIMNKYNTKKHCVVTIMQKHISQNKVIFLYSFYK